MADNVAGDGSSGVAVGDQNPGSAGKFQNCQIQLLRLRVQEI